MDSEKRENYRFYYDMLRAFAIVALALTSIIITNEGVTFYYRLGILLCLIFPGYGVIDRILKKDKEFVKLPLLKKKVNFYTYSWFRFVLVPLLVFLVKTFQNQTFRISTIVLFVILLSYDLWVLINRKSGTSNVGLV